MKRACYKIKYENGNVRMFYADNIYEVMEFIISERETKGHEIVDIYSIEKID